MNEILDLAIETAENEFGKKQHNKEILSVKFRAGGPDCSYPNNSSIEVTISENCKIEIHRAYYQLSHEAVHLLSPVSKNDVTVLEEGVATYFSHKFMTEHTEVVWDTSGDEKYDEAWHLVEQLINIEPQAIKSIMSHFGTLSILRSEDVIEVFPKVPKDVIEKLLQKFN